MKKQKPLKEIQTTSNSLLIGCYSRVSTDEQANVIEGSLDNQRHRMQSFIEIKNMQESQWGELAEHFIDDGYSAKDTNRPAYTRMMKALKSGKINAIMVTELSRLSRNIPDFCEFHKMLEQYGAKFFSIKEQFDSSTPAGKMMLYNMINLAQFEREQTSERVAINCYARAQRGLLNGGPAILGYDKEPSKKTTFVINEEEAAQVRRIFELYLEQRTLSRTIDCLSTEEIKPKARKRPHNRLVEEGRWTNDSLSFTLRNKAYIAIREVNKGNQSKDQRKLKSWQQYGEFPASWPPIIDEKTFKAVNKLMDENTNTERMRLETSTSRVFAASGLCVCEECGRKLVGQSAHGKHRVHKYYVHSTKKGDVINCSIKRIRADKIESQIASYLGQILIQAGYFEQIETRIRDIATDSPERLKSEQKRLLRELADISLSIKNAFKIQSNLDADSLAIKETAKELEKLSHKKRLIETQLESLKTKEMIQNDLDDAIVDLKERLMAFKRGWAKAPAMMKKVLFKELIQLILISPQGVKIQYKLKHGLSEPLPLLENNIISIDKHRSKKEKTTDLSVVNDKPYNWDIQNLQVVGFGRGRRNEAQYPFSR